jgi:hypothetical protein
MQALRKILRTRIANDLRKKRYPVQELLPKSRWSEVGSPERIYW